MRSLPPRRRRRRLRRTKLALTVARLRRSSVFTLAAALSAAALAGTTTAQLHGDAAAARDRWGKLVEIGVVARDVAAGEVITVGDLRVERRPRHLLPDGALATGDAVGRVALAALVKGDVVVASRTGGDLVPAGWRAIGIPPPGTGAHPDVMPGDAVDVLDVGATEGTTVAGGIVVAVRPEDGMVTVAVPAGAAPGVAYAAVAGTAVLALTAAPPPR